MTGADASARRDPADARWALLEPLLPAARHDRRRAATHPGRGAPAGARPAHCRSWWRARALYRARRLNGVRERIEAAPVARADAAGRIDWRVSVDMRRRARPRPARAGDPRGRRRARPGPSQARPRPSHRVLQLAVRYRTTTRITAIDH